MKEWQPIETAPRDGTEILGFGLWAGEIHGAAEAGPSLAIISWSDGSTDHDGYTWDVSGGDAYATWLKPTHWMLLPEPPDG